MDEPLVSVIIPVYNAEHYLRSSVQSVLDQSWKQLEILLIDDCSTDNSREIMLELSVHPNIRSIYMPVNSGAAATRNAGILEATGRFIAFLDADDRWMPDKLERQIPFMMREKCALTCTAYDWVEANGAPAGRTIHTPQTITHRDLLKHNSIGCLTAVYDTTICGKLYMPDTPQRHDWGLWLSITRQFGPAKGLDLVLAAYRLHDQSLSRNKLRSARYNWIILREHEGLSRPVAAWYYLHFLIRKSWKYLGWNS